MRIAVIVVFRQYDWVCCRDDRASIANRCFANEALIVGIVGALLCREKRNVGNECVVRVVGGL